ncbi:uncharacterized protein LAESUDRAFT_752449, partial [Laetiporus sulphureus 93-53]
MTFMRAITAVYGDIGRAPSALLFNGGVQGNAVNLQWYTSPYAHAANTESSLMYIALPYNRVFLRSIDDFKPCYHDARLWVANPNQILLMPFEETSRSCWWRTTLSSSTVRVQEC